jgi:inner membrane protein
MDPVAHTLVGAMLAETGLKKATPLATAALVIGANAPDIDIVAAFGGADEALYWRRGLTHGVLGVALLPVAIMGVLLLWDRSLRLKLRSDAAPARARPLLALALLAVLTHPALDWLNSYGVRLLMPFDGTWFYGDALFIIDPWLWLLTGAAVVLARSRGGLSAAAFLLLGCATTALVTLTGFASLAAKVVWGGGIAAIVALRLSHWAQRRVPQLATACAAALLLYVGAMLAAGHGAGAQASAWLEHQGITVDEVANNPLPADPFTSEVIARSADTYYFVERAWLRQPGLRFSDPSVQVGRRDTVVQAALAAPWLRGERNWLRFPSYTVREHADGYTVTIRDVRYARINAGLGTAVVELDRALHPLGPGTRVHRNVQTR